MRGAILYAQLLGDIIYVYYLKIPFSAHMSRRFLAVGCGLGIYVGPTNSESKLRVTCFILNHILKSDIRLPLGSKL